MEASNSTKFHLEPQIYAQGSQRRLKQALTVEECVQSVKRHIDQNLRAKNDFAYHFLI